MRLVVQRVSHASVTIETVQKASIGEGLLVFVGFESADTLEDLTWAARKLCKLRIFADENGVMNRSIAEVRGEVLLVSQFTLHAQIRKGNRPSYIRAATPEVAVPLYESFISILEQELHQKIQTGIFGADMKVSLLNDGPVTLWMDTANKE